MARVFTPATPEERRKVATHLANTAVGKENAQKSKALKEVLQEEDSRDWSNPRTRQLVRDLIMEDGLLVVAGQCGYWLPTGPEEARDYAERLDHQAEALMEKAEAVRELANSLEGRGAQALYAPWTNNWTPLEAMDHECSPAPWPPEVSRDPRCHNPGPGGVGGGTHWGPVRQP